MGNKFNLIIYRIEISDENFEAAQLLFEHNKLFNRVSALYYSAFQIVLTVLLTKEIRIKTHKSVFAPRMQLICLYNYLLHLHVKPIL